ncbi:hypothetical protein [Streptomyces sp. NPDC017993]|uniref:hypothetical protein n=1 Tax=Streptomyces sp. NPDC017993 TaxID=3365027 RepID=UPI0037A5A3B7
MSDHTTLHRGRKTVAATLIAAAALALAACQDANSGAADASSSGKPTVSSYSSADSYSSSSSPSADNGGATLGRSAATHAGTFVGHSSGAGKGSRVVRA